MSLVNKMLRDLDARRVGDGDRAALPAAVTPLAARQEPGRGLLWLWLGTALVAVVLGAAAWYATHKPDVPALGPLAAAPSAPSAPVAASAPAAPATPAAESESVPAPAANAALPSLRMTGELSVTPAVAATPPRMTVAATPAPPAPPERPADNAVPSRLPMVTVPKAPPVSAEPSIDKQVRLLSPAEMAEIEYRRGVLAQRQGNAEQAAGSYRAALDDFPEHAAARQALAALLIEAKHFDEAEELLRKGTELPAVRLPSTLALARLKVERNQTPAALELLLQNAASGERSAEYQGFLGALLNRAERAPEAVERYQAAIRLAPNEARWWVGLGIALDAAGKAPEAREAYQKARTLPGLPADLAQHVEQRLR